MISEFIANIGEKAKELDAITWFDGKLTLMNGYDGWAPYLKDMLSNINGFMIFLIVASAVFWTGVYIITIYRNHKDKTSCMPWCALSLNFSWEFIYAFVVPYPEPFTRIGIYFWVALDFVMLYQELKYGKKEYSRVMPGLEKIYWPVKIFVLVSMFTLVLLANAQWPVLPEAPMFTAYLMNLMMSFLFITHMFKRDTVEGTSIWIAWCKFLGTVAPSVLGFTYFRGQWFVYVMAILCAVLDAAYIVLLTKRFKAFGLNPYTRKPLNAAKEEVKAEAAK